MLTTLFAPISLRPPLTFVALLFGMLVGCTETTPRLDHDAIILDASQTEGTEEGPTCVVDSALGGLEVVCSDGSRVPLPQPDGSDGNACHSSVDPAGNIVITCDDGTELVLEPGADGTSCALEVTDEAILVSCEDGAQATILNGTPSQDSLASGDLAGVVLLSGAADHEGSRVRILPDGPELLSAADGSFHFVGLRAGNHTVVLSHDGYGQVFRQVAILPGTYDLGVVTLEWGSELPAENEPQVVGLSPDGRTLLTLSQRSATSYDDQTGTLTAWNLSDESSTVVGTHALQSTLQFTSDGRWLSYVARPNSREMMLFDVEAKTSELLDVAQDVIDAPELFFSPDGAWLANEHQSGDPSLRELSSGVERPLQRTLSFPGASASLVSPGFTADSKYIVAQTELLSVNGGPSIAPPEGFKFISVELDTNPFSPVGGDTLLFIVPAVSGSLSSKCLALYDGETETVSLLNPIVEYIAALHAPWSKDGRYLFFGDRNGQLRRYDNETNTNIVVASLVGAFDITPDGQQVVLQDVEVFLGTYEVSVWDGTTSTLRTIGSSERYTPVLITRDGAYVLWLSSPAMVIDRTLHIAEVATRQGVATFEDPLTTVALSAATDGFVFQLDPGPFPSGLGQILQWTPRATTTLGEHGDLRTAVRTVDGDRLFFIDDAIEAPNQSSYDDFPAAGSLVRVDLTTASREVVDTFVNAHLVINAALLGWSRTQAVYPQREAAFYKVAP
ncbi:MAG: hypothetical protein AUK47_07135 [Deltaproteobacteria bacterium CG2_30_63_29]|nr:MAG: hypothetical protein AUK47_07135 [Deltaproteobacteria bacterium CG2_30_63_29]PIW02667.1 MAG: hypothetical protein COW42_00410 [Deltaproteobacteria bacterium CG17_big_fil_post_rev_8_21_14_2_50_63_7]PJB34517.1 MAG: hypothetical protein CO108_28105 [Deltaproteobacteria bacterium CG_4_9_14_3_um_filter_63_12]